MEGYKRCSICGEEKPLEDFHKNSYVKSGRLAKCKDWASKAYAKYREENRAKELARKRKYNREHKEERAQYKKEHYAGITPATRAHLIEWKKQNRDKLLAHKKVYNAIKRGKLVRMPCEICGTDSAVHAHHDDYSRPLDVIWLCQKHHRWIHS